LLILDDEAPTVGGPANNIMEIDAGQHGVDLGEEGRYGMLLVGILFGCALHIFNTKTKNKLIN
jgi:hypothetical protein